MENKTYCLNNFRKSELVLNDISFPTTQPPSNSLYDYLKWVNDNYYDVINKEEVHTSHFCRMNHCKHNEYYFISVCPKCTKLHYNKLPCNSFFCDDCHTYLVNRAKSSLAEYLWNVNHRFVIFTTPPQVRDNLRWDNMHWFYKVVHRTMKQYFSHYYHNRKVQVGMIAYLHSYGSIDLNWKPHLNIMWSCKGFLERKGETHLVNTGYVDYIKLRKIYKANLEYYFKVKLEKEPVIYFDDVQDKKDRTLGLPPQKIINKLLAYFKKLPFTDKRESGVKSNIISVDNLGNITWTTYKRKQKRLPPITSPPTLFYNRIMQHIPPKNFRNVRLWSCYQYQHHLRKMIKPLKESTTVKPQTCLDCKLELVPVMIVANNIIRFIKLDYKDFSTYFKGENPELLGTEPPGELKPPKDSLEFPNFSKKSKKKRAEPQPLPIKQPLEPGIIETDE